MQTRLRGKGKGKERAAGEMFTLQTQAGLILRNFGTFYALKEAVARADIML